MCTAPGKAMDLEDRGTGLAKVWEKDAEIRRRIAAGKLVTRLHLAYSTMHDNMLGLL